MNLEDLETYVLFSGNIMNLNYEPHARETSETYKSI